MELSITQIASIFVVLFALIDVLGSVPVFLNYQANGRDINPLKASFYTLFIFILFLLIGEWILKLFNVDVSSFAVAGALIIFMISIEMIFGIEIFKNDAPTGSSTLVPVVFPLIAGPGTFTSLLSMRAEYDIVNILAGLLLNIMVVYLTLRNLGLVKKIIGVGGVYVMRKFFGIILMAIAIRLFTSNYNALIESFH